MVIGSVISENQSAFLKDRLILDGPLILNEVLAWARKNGRELFLFKIDFAKAYDNVNWRFLSSIMLQLGFPPKWCLWIQGILSSARSSVLVNGSPTFEFQCHKGMRQGDPISPFLILLVMEAFSSMIRKACGVGAFRGIALPKEGPILSHLLYADDCVVIREWARNNIKKVALLLRCFYICSGLKINMSKSCLFGVGVDGGAIEDMAAVLKCSASLLSIGGHVTLIKSVLESLPNYYLSLLKAPLSVVNKLQAIIKIFLWSGGSSVRKLHWVAWDRTSAPIDKGGLGLADLRDINTALLSKWVWRYRNEMKESHCGEKWWILSTFLTEGGYNCSLQAFLGQWGWSRSLASAEEWNEWNILSSMLESMKLSDREDKWEWIGGSDNSFLVVAVKQFHRSIDDFSNNYVFKWSSWVPKKVNILFWRAQMGRIATLDALVKRNCFNGDESCVFCSEGRETADNIFRSCVMASKVWYHVSRWCNISPIFAFSLEDLLEVHDFSGLGAKSKDILKDIIMVGWWCIWKPRKERRFSNKHSSVASIVQDIKALGYLWYSNRSKFRDVSWENWFLFSIM
ncbi:putative RNA-directed DNA polymerase [Helianthus debilis subsp. tardiflorus]